MRLDVWMEAVEGRIGVLERATDKSMRFTYDPGLPAAGRVSLAMPVRDETYGDAACRAYFGNLSFEGGQRDRVIEDYGLDRDDTAGILFHLGADCAGAVSVTPDGQGPGKRPGRFPDEYEEIPPARLAEIVRSLHFHKRMPADARNPSPVAGVQPKLALVAHEDRYYLPRVGSGAPTTHILKVSPRDDAALTRHETALLDLARRRGIETAETRRQVFYDEDTCAEIEALVSTRFDRAFADGEIRRIHAEDFAQAAGLEAGLKYERDDRATDRAFSAARIGEISRHMAGPGPFRLAVLRHTIFNLLVGNTDNHAKNGTVLYDGGRGRLAPLYDVVPVTLSNRHTHTFAFAHGAAHYVEDLTRADLASLAQSLGLRKMPFAMVEKDLRKIAEDAIPLLEEAGGKALADAVAAQMAVVGDALEIELEIPARDYFPRAVRDEEPAHGAGGWTALS